MYGAAAVVAPGHDATIDFDASDELWACAGRPASPFDVVERPAHLTAHVAFGEQAPLTIDRDVSYRCDYGGSTVGS